MSSINGPLRPAAASYSDLDRLDQKILDRDRFASGGQAFEIGLDRFADVGNRLIDGISLGVAALEAGAKRVEAALRFAFENHRKMMFVHRFASFDRCPQPVAALSEYTVKRRE
jgi:hypothetical protein